MNNIFYLVPYFIKSSNEGGYKDLQWLIPGGNKEGARCECDLTGW